MTAASDAALARVTRTSLTPLAAHALLVLMLTAPAAAQSPVINAVVEHRAATDGLARELQTIVRQGPAVWVGYRVPIAASRGERLDGAPTCCGRCRLEPPTDLVMLIKVDRDGVVDIRPEAVDCDIDASGTPLVWLDTVRPDDSVTWLAGVARDTSARTGRLADRALTALALHASAAASPVLVDLARTGSTAQLKGRALFWLAQRAVEEAIPTITSALDNDPDTEVKKQAVFALSRMPKDDGVPRLIELARSHRNPEVRRQAFFWLGQSRDPRATEFLAAIVSK